MKTNLYLVRKPLLVFMMLLAALLPIFSQETETAAEVAHLPVDFLWMVIAGFLVFFMQAGFALVETGLTRAKNAGNIIMKNVMDFCVGAIGYFIIGWAFMYGGGALEGFIGLSDFFVTSASDALAGGEVNEGMWIYASWFFQVVFAATAATIVSGAMAERTKFTSYLIYCVFISAIIYPVSGHWIWSENGWLTSLGFHDFAGSTVVHSVGGWAALMGALILGPRTGKYVGGKAKAIPGHNITLAALGVFILWFGWYGFNAGSTLGYDDALAHIAVTTGLAASAGGIAAMIAVWLLNKKPDVSMTLNGVLAGLVAITAPCAVVSPTSAIIIGLVGGVIVVLSVEFIDKILKIDDPVGAVSVHGVTGVWGTLAVGLFAEEKFSGEIQGLFFGGGFSQLGVQLTGVLTVAAWVLATSAVLFLGIKYTVGLRVSKEEELRGLDICEHGMGAYSGFQIIE